jgi:5-oxoprolinase (ATP-hydrolysing)
MNAFIVLDIMLTMMHNLDAHSFTTTKIEVWNELNLEKLETDLVHLRDVKKITNIAVLLIHSYLYHEHELRIGQLAASLGFNNISLSHQISSMIRAVPRGLTSWLKPHYELVI